jgi:hypothetical protein
MRKKPVTSFVKGILDPKENKEASEIAFLFFLAESLKKSLKEVLELTSEEIKLWSVYFEARAKAEEIQLKMGS